MIKKQDAEFDIFPTHPNEVTAVTEYELKFGKSDMYYQNHNSEYIVYNDALVRVRYIIQLSQKFSVSSDFNDGNEYKKTRKANKHYQKY